MPEISSPSIEQNQLLSLPSGGGIVSAFSTRGFGNMSFCYGDTAHSLESRKNFLDKIGIDYSRLTCAKQVHGSNVKYAAEVDAGRGALCCDDSLPDTDGLITDKRHLPLAIFTADCLSVFLYDPGRPAVGLIHAGRRSSQERIVFKAVQLMKRHFDTRTEDLRVGFGPAIRDCCYELDKGSAAGLVERDNRYYFNLAAVNKEQLLSCGVKEPNIFDCKACTCCDSGGFFSYRREGKACGRMISVIMLR